jgi:AraC-like DNA-binding protein
LGKIAANILIAGDGWSAADMVCTMGPRDHFFEEQHTMISISVVIEGSFQYRSTNGSEIMSPGSLLLGNRGQYFECRHDHGVGDRCLAFFYAPEFFERESLTGSFPAQRIPAIPNLAPCVVNARRAIDDPKDVVLQELAYALPVAVEDLGLSRRSSLLPSAADERRISTILRFIEANLTEPLPLGRLAAIAKMSNFHFLRTFKQIMQVTPHQYILRARLRKAAVQLKTNKDKILEIALDAGFRDLSNFNQAFRTEFGVSPMRFRREER